MTGRLRQAVRSPFVLPGVVTAVLVPVLIVAGTDAVPIVAWAAVVGAVGFAIVARPRVVLHGFPVVLGFAPFMHVPSTSVPLLLVMSVLVWPALVFLPGTDIRLGWPEAVVAVLAGVTFCSVIATGTGTRAWIEWIAWVSATAVVLPIRQLPAELRASVCRTLALSTTAGAALALAIRAGLPRPILSALEIFGYDRIRNARYVSGERLINRLTGTYLEPNLGALILLVGLAAAVIFLRGRLRIVSVSIITVAVLLTLSRSAFGTAVLATLIVLMRAPERRRALAAWAVTTAVVALALPSVRSRLADSLGPRDVGLSERRAALDVFPSLMDGHWWWGLGWARPEFRNAGLSQATNLVANGPLLTVYRGGLVVGAAIVVAAIVVAIRAWIYADRSFAAAVACGLLIAMLLVAFQLDFPIVNQAPATAAMSFLIAMTLFLPRPEPADARRDP